VRQRRGRGGRLRRLDLGDARAMAAAVCCFLVVRLMRASEAMWRVMWVFCQAHLSGLLEERRLKEKCNVGTDEATRMQDNGKVEESRDSG